MLNKPCDNMTHKALEPESIAFGLYQRWPWKHSFVKVKVTYQFPPIIMNNINKGGIGLLQGVISWGDAGRWLERNGSALCTDYAGACGPPSITNQDTNVAEMQVNGHLELAVYCRQHVWRHIGGLTHLFLCVLKCSSLPLLTCWFYLSVTMVVLWYYLTCGLM